MKELPDERLIAAARAGDPEAIGALYDRYHLRLYNYVLRLVGDRDRAADILQEVFLRLLRTLDGIEKKSRVRSWLFTVAHNLVVDEYRRKGVEISTEASRSIDRLPEIRTREPGSIAERKEMLERLEEAVRELPLAQRSVFLLRRTTDMTFEEIAEVQGCPLGTALGRMHDAMKALKKKLGEEKP